MAFATVFVFLTGVIIRQWLFCSPNLARWLAERNELNTPLTSWKRMTEGLALVRAGVSPYSGDVFHETPLMLTFIGFMDDWLGSNRMWMVFLIADMLTAMVLSAVATEISSYLLKRQETEKSRYDSSSEKLFFNPSALALSQFYVLVAYALNPLTIASCAAMSTAVFHNLILAIFLLCLLNGNRLLVCLFAALAAYENMYPVMLIVPAAILIAHRDSKSYELSTGLAAKSVFQTMICFASATILLALWSHALNEGSWDFIRSTYGFTLSVPDLSPNIGVFWYFFTEVFDHFRSFFVFVFQAHAFIYLAPLTIRLRNHPLFLTYILIALSAVFRSYPSLADTAFYMALLPMWRHLFVYMRNEFVAGIMFVVGVVLAPLMWYLWIAAGSANANFYFAITLVICASQVFLLTDLLLAFIRREFDLVRGIKLVTADGKPAVIILD